MQNPLVSIITPCYNGEKYLDIFFNSILNQTYKSIELIFINDGSTDNTENIALDYSRKFKESGYKFIYKYQENQGQAVAVNKGLKLYTGEYLVWLDSDDFLMPESIQKRVEFLEQNDEYGFVRSDAYIYNENELTKPIARLNKINFRKSDVHIFNRLILEQNMPAMNGTYMVRTKALEKAIPNRDIFCSKGGQNWQIELPVAYMHKCGYIDIPLFGYVIRENSHSRSVNSNDLKRVFERYDIHKEIIIRTIERIPLDHSKYKRMVDEKYTRLKFIAAIDTKEFDTSKIYYNMLKLSKSLRCSDRLRFIFRQMPIALRLLADVNKVLFHLGIYEF